MKWTTTKNTPENFWQRTEPEGACVVWTGYRNDGGYGVLGWDGNPHERAHRVAFFLRMGRWPDGILRHLCNNPPCVLHAVEGTLSENTQDMVTAGTHNRARATHCPQGHPYDEENTRWYEGRRYCKACPRERYRARRRQAAERAA